MWTLQILLATVACVAALEVGIPERYLRPRNFNPHPYTDLAQSSLDAGPIRQELYPSQLVRDSIPELPDHPYAYFRRPPSRGEDDRAPIQFPKVPEAANIPQAGSRLKPPEIKHPLNLGAIPQQRLFAQQLPQQINPNKKYAFSYSVLDKNSGDDFSHSQAGSHAQTKGEYRVRLPDGRTQVVSYTADDRGYRADVRYDEANLVKPAFTQAIYRQPLPQKQQSLQYDYEEVTKPPTRQYTPIHEEDYGDYQENTVSSTPSYKEDSALTGYIEQVPARAFQENPVKYISTPARLTSARLIGSTPSPLSASPSSLEYRGNQQDYYFTTPSPIKLFVGPDGQLYRQSK